MKSLETEYAFSAEANNQDSPDGINVNPGRSMGFPEIIMSTWILLMERILSKLPLRYVTRTFKMKPLRSHLMAP